MYVWLVERVREPTQETSDCLCSGLHLGSCSDGVCLVTGETHTVQVMNCLLQGQTANAVVNLINLWIQLQDLPGPLGHLATENEAGKHDLGMGRRCCCVVALEISWALAEITTWLAQRATQRWQDALASRCRAGLSLEARAKRWTNVVTAPHNHHLNTARFKRSRRRSQRSANDVATPNCCLLQHPYCLTLQAQLEMATSTSCNFWSQLLQPFKLTRVVQHGATPLFCAAHNDERSSQPSRLNCIFSHADLEDRLWLEQLFLHSLPLVFTRCPSTRASQS